MGAKISQLIFALMLALAGTAAWVPAEASAFSADQSDVWWNPDESGWGVQFVQTGSAIFATMYVYGPTGQPTWYTATLEASPRPDLHEWSGDLIATTGPWHGEMTFDPALVSRRVVGTMTWAPSSLLAGQLTYSMDGGTVSKTLHRQTLRYDNHAGQYMGLTGRELCGTGSANFQPTSFKVTQGPNQLVVEAGMPSEVLVGFTGCRFTGDYVQFGHFGQSQGTFTCDDGSSGTHIFSGMTVARNVLSAGKKWHTEFIATFPSGCRVWGELWGFAAEL